MFKKIFIGFTIIILVAISFSVYIHEENIDDLAYIIAVAIDKGENDILDITFQMSIPNESKSSESNGSKSSSESGGSSKDTVSKTIECKSFNSGINQLNNLTSKRVDLSHCKLIIFSEEIAKDGVSDFIYTLENNLQLRSNCSILVSNSKAKDFLENSTPTFESSTVSFYETIRNSSKYTGYTYNVDLNHFYTSIYDSFGEPCATLTYVTNKKEEDSDSSSNENSSNKKDIKFDGLAVFKGDKLIGELSPEETLCFLIVTNNLKRAILSIPSPFDENKTIDIHLSKFDNTKHSVKIENSIPNISTNIYLDCTILSSSLDFNANDSQYMDNLELSVSDYIKKTIENFYQKISKEYKSDICGFGKYAVKFFLTENEWKSYNWNDVFSESTFDVKTNINVNTSYFIS